MAKSKPSATGKPTPCVVCGKTLSPGATFCVACGANNLASSAAAEELFKADQRIERSRVYGTVFRMLGWFSFVTRFFR